MSLLGFSCVILRYPFTLTTQPIACCKCRVSVRTRLLTGIHGGLVGGVDDEDVRDGQWPRRCPAGPFSWSGCRCSAQSAVTSVTAARVADSSTMALPAAKVATRAWVARLLTARG
jgi:hypothetical protein